MDSLFHITMSNIMNNAHPARKGSIYTYKMRKISRTILCSALVVATVVLVSCVSKKSVTYPQRYVFVPVIDSVVDRTSAFFGSNYRATTLFNSYLVFDGENTGYIGQDSVSFLHFTYKRLSRRNFLVKEVSGKCINAKFDRDTLWVVKNHCFARFLKDGERKWILFRRDNKFCRGFMRCVDRIDEYFYHHNEPAGTAVSYTDFRLSVDSISRFVDVAPFNIEGLPLDSISSDTFYRTKVSWTKWLNHSTETDKLVWK